MTRRLDVASLVSIVGVEKLQKELDSDVWYFQVVHISPGAQISIERHIRFRTQANPIEYLLFNEPEFFVAAIYNSSFDLSFIKESLREMELVPRNKKLTREIVLEEIDDYVIYNIADVPVDWADYIWNQVKEMTANEINQLFDVYYLHNIHKQLFLIDYDFFQILPKTYNFRESADQFLEEWFPNK